MALRSFRLHFRERRAGVQKSKIGVKQRDETMSQCSPALPHMFSNLMQKMAGWLPGRRSLASPHGDAETQPAQAAVEEPKVQLFMPSGNCLGCRNYRARVADPRGKESAQNEARAAICAIRGIELREPLTTYCKNFDSA